MDTRNNISFGALRIKGGILHMDALNFAQKAGGITDTKGAFSVLTQEGDMLVLGKEEKGIIEELYQKAAKPFVSLELKQVPKNKIAHIKAELIAAEAKLNAEVAKFIKENNPKTVEYLG